MTGFCIQQEDIIFLLSISFVPLQAIRTVQDCPRSNGKWRDRASRMPCDAGKEYHCMMAEDFSLVEICMGVRKIDSGKINVFLNLSNDRPSVEQ